MLSTLTYNTNSRSYKHIIIQAETLALVNHAWAHDTMSLVRLKVAPWFYEADLSMEREGQWVREERRAPYLLATIETADKMRALAVLDRELIHLHKRLTPLFRGMIAGGRVDHEKVVGAQLFNSLVVECGTYPLPLSVLREIWLIDDQPSMLLCVGTRWMRGSWRPSLQPNARIKTLTKKAEGSQELSIPRPAPIRRGHSVPH